MVRMWMIQPAVLCRRHLLGEHVECHMILGSIMRGKSIKGHTTKFQVFPKHLVGRHNELVREMQRRGYKHNSEIPVHPCLLKVLELIPQHSMPPTLGVDNLAELYSKCPDCRERMQKMGYGWERVTELVR